MIRLNKKQKRRSREHCQCPERSQMKQIRQIFVAATSESDENGCQPQKPLYATSVTGIWPFVQMTMPFSANFVWAPMPPAIIPFTERQSNPIKPTRATQQATTGEPTSHNRRRAADRSIDRSRRAREVQATSKQRRKPESFESPREESADGWLPLNASFESMREEPSSAAAAAAKRRRLRSFSDQRGALRTFESTRDDPLSAAADAASNV